MGRPHAKQMPTLLYYYSGLRDDSNKGQWKVSYPSFKGRPESPRNSFSDIPSRFREEGFDIGSCFCLDLSDLDVLVKCVSLLLFLVMVSWAVVTSIHKQGCPLTPLSRAQKLQATMSPARLSLRASEDLSGGWICGRLAAISAPSFSCPLVVGSFLLVSKCWLARRDLGKMSPF